MRPLKLLLSLMMVVTVTSSCGADPQGRPSWCSAGNDLAWWADYGAGDIEGGPRAPAQVKAWAAGMRDTLSRLHKDGPKGETDDLASLDRTWATNYQYLSDIGFDLTGAKYQQWAGIQQAQDPAPGKRVYRAVKSTCQVKGESFPKKPDGAP